MFYSHIILSVGADGLTTVLENNRGETLSSHFEISDVDAFTIREWLALPAFPNCGEHSQSQASQSTGN